jgi:hypothetical protein
VSRSLRAYRYVTGMPTVQCVAFDRCPYDASPIDAEAYTGGATLLSCPTCGAAWGWRKTWLRRIREPDPEVIRLARDDDPPRLVSGVQAADARATFRGVRSSISSITRGSNKTPPTRA